MDCALGEVVDVVDVNADVAFGDEVEEVGGIVKDGETGGDPEGRDPGFELGQFRVRVELVERDDVVGQNGPEGVGDLASQPGAVQEAAHARARLLGDGIGPDARAEPGQEARGDELLEPPVQWSYVGRRHPARAVAVVADNPVDLGAGGGSGIDGVPGRLGGPQHGDVVLGLLDSRLVVDGHVGRVEERPVEGLLPLDVRQIGLRRDARGQNELARAHLDLNAAVCCRIDVGHRPGSVVVVLHDCHPALQPDALHNAKVLRVPLEIPLDDVARDVLAVLDAVGIIHGEVRVLVRAAHVVGLEAVPQSVRGPDAADRGCALEQTYGRRGMDFAVCLEGSKAAPA